MKAEEKVRKLAYKLYEKRGSASGHELDDWLKAERIIKRRRKIFWIIIGLLCTVFLYSKNQYALSLITLSFFGFCLFGQRRNLIQNIGIVTPMLILLLQNTPRLEISRIDGGFSDTGKIYFYVKNTGNIPAFCIKGRFIITSNAQKTSQVSEKEFVLTPSIAMDTDDNTIFYPTGENAEIPLVYTVNLKRIEKEFNSLPAPIKREFTFVSIYFVYPQFKVFGEHLFPRIYEGVFQYSPDENKKEQWVFSSSTVFPKFFNKIFTALKKYKEPSFDYNAFKSQKKDE